MYIFKKARKLFYKKANYYIFVEKLK